MTCPDRLDQLFVWVHQPVWLDCEVAVEGEKMVQPSIALVGPWYLLWPSFGLGLGGCWLGGHRRPMVGYPEFFSMYRFVAAR